MTPRFNFSIDLPVRNEWSNVDLMRTSVQNCLSVMFNDIDGCHSMAMVTGELLENAVKYGGWDGAEAALRLRVWGFGTTLRVSVENPVKVGDENVEELRKMLDWMAEQPSIEDAFRSRMLQIASAERRPGFSGLGLVRVAYEAGARVTAELLDGGVLRVQAEMQI